VRFEIANSNNLKNSKNENNKDSVRHDLKEFNNPDNDEAIYNNQINLRKI